MSRAERDAVYNNSAAVTDSAELNAARETGSAEINDALDWLAEHGPARQLRLLA
jgi:hypothetical protein